MEAENRVRGEEPIEDIRSPDGGTIDGSQNQRVEKEDGEVDKKSPNPALGQSRPAVPPTPPPAQPPESVLKRCMASAKTSKEVLTEVQGQEESKGGMGSTQGSCRAVEEEVWWRRPQMILKRPPKMRRNMNSTWASHHCSRQRKSSIWLSLTCKLLGCMEPVPLHSFRQFRGLGS